MSTSGNEMMIPVAPDYSNESFVVVLGYLPTQMGIAPELCVDRKKKRSNQSHSGETQIVKSSGDFDDVRRYA